MDRSGYVRPRFTDGTFDDALPLVEHFAEQFLAGPAVPALVVEGARGSGLTTTLHLLADAAAAAGRTPRFASELMTGDGRDALRELARPGAVLFVDLSVTPLGGADRALLDALGPAYLRSRPLVVAGTDLAPFLRWSGLPASARVTLAPWGRDELIELLGTEPYREHRARIHAGLARMEGSHGLLARPRTARWLVDAACRLDEGEPFTRSRVFASFLDELSPETIALARAARSVGIREIAASGGPLEEILALYDVSPRTARILLARGDRPGPLPVRGSAPLALPGLMDFLRAGAIVKKVAESEVPPVDAAVLPFVTEMMTPALEARLVEWLAADDAPVGARAVSATVLHALGRALPTNLNSTNLAGALLAGADLKGRHLRSATLGRADLTGARLDEGVMQLSVLEEATATGASFDRAWLFASKMSGGQFPGASFRGTTLVKAVARHANFQGACFAGALLGGATLERCDLERADLTEASFRETFLSHCRLNDADFTGADMKDVRLSALDLAVARFAPASVVHAHFSACSLAAMDVSEAVAATARFLGSDLSATVLRGAQLQDARFEQCWAHDAVFDEADLRGAWFHACNFHAGSSRSGLLLGKPALEGNKTGFYAEGTTDDAWASPDSIRQASFRGADLRGAKFTDTDLFRVDFRGAILDGGLRELALKAGAIVD